MSATEKPEAASVGTRFDDLQGTGSRTGLVAAGGVLGALAASSCCVIPLALFSVGIGGAWVGNLSALAPYQPIFAVATFGILAYGFYLVYWKPRKAYADGSYCVGPTSGKFVKSALWIATVLVVTASAFPFVAPYLLEYY